MVNAEFSRIYRFVKLLVNEGFLAVVATLLSSWPAASVQKKNTTFCPIKLLEIGCNTSPREKLV